jgi:hypothetical protein
VRASAAVRDYESARGPTEDHEGGAEPHTASDTLGDGATRSCGVEAGLKTQGQGVVDGISSAVFKQVPARRGWVGDGRWRGESARRGMVAAT